MSTSDARRDTEELYRDLRVRLLAFLESRVAIREDAEDILQEIFARIHERAPHMKNVESVSGFLFRSARNALSDYYRRRAAAGRTSRALAESAAGRGPVSAEGDEDEEGAAGELAGCVGPFLAKLDERFRVVLELTEMREWTQREAAERLGLSLSAVKSRVSRGREKLRELLLDCCHVELDRRRGIAELAPRDECACHCRH